MTLSSLIRLLRPLQWAKNLFVFIPMFFSGNLLNAEDWVEGAIAFVCFSMVASGVYCLNDLKDVEADRLHPTKRLRPIASGEVSVGSARAIMLLLMAGGLCIAWFGLPETPSATAIIATYLLINIAYCLGLKKFAIIDVFIVATGFVLRVLAGGMACDIWVSPWLICMTFLLALFLAFAKRRDDVALMESEGVVVRKNIVRYNSAFLNQTLGILAAVTMMSYIMYTVSPEVEARLGSQYIFITSVFVLAGILRYLQVAIVDLRSGSPTKILARDRFIQFTILGWILTFIAIIYL